MPKINLEGRSSTPDVDIRNVETAFDPEARQAQQDWLDFLKQRPYQDAKGNIHNPENGRFMAVDMTDDGNRAYYDKIARDTLHETSREGLGVMSLARLAREARLNGDKTMLNDILDEVQDKLVEMEAKYDWNADSSTAHLDKVMSIIYGDDAVENVAGDGAQETDIEAIHSDADGDSLAGEVLDVQEEREELASDDAAEADIAADASNEIPQDSPDREERASYEGRQLPVGELYPNPHPKEVIGQTSQELTPPSAIGKELVPYAEHGKELVPHKQGKEVELYSTDKLIEQMEYARDAYLEEAAKIQKSHWYGVKGSRAFMWLQGKFPKVADKIADVLSKPQDRLEELGRGYEAALKDVANIICHTDEERREYFVDQIAEDAQRIVMLQKEKAPKPMSKWLRRAGYAAAGVAGGLIAFSGLGVVAGAGLAGAGALAIRGRANKRNANTMVRNEEGELRSAAYANADMVVDRFKNSYENPTETQFIGHLNEMTDKEVQKNRRRMLWPFIGAVGVALATKYGADFAYSWMTPDTPTAPEPNPGNTPDNTTSTPETSTSPEPKSEPAPQEEFISGQEFVVESGNGYTHELMDFASANGKNLSPEQAFDLHNHLVSQFGADYIDISGASSDIYTDAGDYRLTQPGAARWTDGVVEEAQRWMAGRGLW
ncbi:MAG: hypothetical protein Q4A37_02390 [Candidatus Saccharibacteria bacterium]|nr:hypothetical protein [Candidatus Saccharibacteria bacterium]